MGPVHTPLMVSIQLLDIHLHINSLLFVLIVHSGSKNTSLESTFEYKFSCIEINADVIFYHDLS